MPADTLPVEPGTGLLAGAEKARDVAAQHAAEADTSRRLPPEVVDALRDAGFARHFVASRWGGSEGTFTELVRAVFTVGEGCASTAWCASLSAASARFAAHLPQEGHRAVWEGNPDAFVATGLVPSGKAVPAEGGWTLGGRWGYVSGIEFADWALLCAAAFAGEGEPELRFFALPRGAYTVIESWDSVGMRATGSHTVAVHEVFVPAHLSFARAEMVSGRNAWSTLPAHNVPFQASGALTFVGPAVGAAYGALNATLAVVAGKKRLPANDVELVRATGRIDAARYLVEQNATVIDERTFTPGLLARNQRNASFSAELVTEAVDALLKAGGTSGLSEAQPLQRFWRDVHGAASHVALRFDVTGTAENYAKALLAAE